MAQQSRQTFDFRNVEQARPKGCTSRGPATVHYPHISSPPLDGSSPLQTGIARDRDVRGSQKPEDYASVYSTEQCGAGGACAARHEEPRGAKKTQARTGTAVARK